MLGSYTITYCLVGFGKTKWLLPVPHRTTQGLLSMLWELRLHGWLTLVAFPKLTQICR